MTAKTGSAAVTVGRPAPDFTLKDENEQDVQLSRLRGRPVVLIFYPFDWSGACDEELCAIRDDFRAFEDRGAVVLGISRDSHYSHKAWKAHMGYRHPLLADLDGQVARPYGAWNAAESRADRQTVVLDAEGIVRYVVNNGGWPKRDHREALRALDALSAAH